MASPRRTLALGLPYDDGRVPPAPKEETTDDRLARLERQLDRIEGTVRLLLAMKRQSMSASEGEGT
jgi:hypothetical protein